MAAAITSSTRCGKCERRLNEVDSGCYVTLACNHIFHEGCFANDGLAHYPSRGDIKCPITRCANVVVNVGASEKREDKVKDAVTSGQVSHMTPSALSTLKKIIKVALVFCFTCLSLAFSPSWIALGVGVAAGVGSGYMVGKFLDKKYNQT